MSSETVYCCDFCPNEISHHKMLEALELILEVSKRNNYETYRMAVKEIAVQAIQKIEK